MTRHILIVDAVATNRIVLKVKLASAFYSVAQASSGAEAVQSARQSKPSVIIVGSLRDMTGADLCQTLKSDPRTRQAAIVILTSDADSRARLAALQAGADDVVSKPCDDAVLLARLRSLQRGRDAAAEMQLREETHRTLGLSEAETRPFDVPGRIAVIAADRGTAAQEVQALRRILPHKIELHATQDFLRRATDPVRMHATPDAFLLVLTQDTASKELQVLPDLRTWDPTRRAGVLVVAPPGDRISTASALDLGADDVVKRGTSRDEIALRLDRLVRRKHRADELRDTLQDGLRAAVTDPLTGLHNRRFALPHLARVADRARRSARSFAVMVADLDHFKQINDRYGHAAGDAVLCEVSSRMTSCLRPVDLVARIGGEEFLIVMPDVTGRAAQATAHRLRAAIADARFAVPGRSEPIGVTISIGVTLEQGTITPSAPDGRSIASATDAAVAEALLARADQALYAAKAHGRNQVELDRPAA
ncbi:diguanylate cyclase [Primorskyibacter aestuariivivens]|uniref:diguanylate cyclase domain-containing protein n=1 Tax=Primorskyibacter aestuariivivens TaxID=1888912 RepID=UPI0023017D9A|nr:diguanylate cyclase [Primorskyibacter aestuariivivens]MDA7427966.1 diguanylate cyclase [Primorskyibacter aestuariivivens]